MQIVLVMPRLEFVHCVSANAQDNRVAALDLRQIIAEGAGLLGTSRSICFWESENDNISAPVITEADGFAVLIGQFKIWRLLTDVHDAGYPQPYCRLLR